MNPKSRTHTSNVLAKNRRESTTLCIGVTSMDERSQACRKNAHVGRRSDAPVLSFPGKPKGGSSCVTVIRTPGPPDDPDRSQLLTDCRKRQTLPDHEHNDVGKR